MSSKNFQNGIILLKFTPDPEYNGDHVFRYAFKYAERGKYNPPVFFFDSDYFNAQKHKIMDLFPLSHRNHYFLMSVSVFATHLYADIKDINVYCVGEK